MSNPKPPRPPQGNDYLQPARPGGPGTTNAPPARTHREAKSTQVKTK
ncbi:hypothetical protein [Bradyrhizobium genomosp. III]|nr:hypothetical protein [Bradyrhizobium sp. CCBAU 15544]